MVFIGKSDLGEGDVARAKARLELAEEFAKVGRIPSSGLASLLLERDAASFVIRSAGYDVDGDRVVEAKRGLLKGFLSHFALAMPIAFVELLLFGYKITSKVAYLSIVIALVSTAAASAVMRVLAKHPAKWWNPVYVGALSRRESLDTLSKAYAELLRNDD